MYGVIKSVLLRSPIAAPLLLYFSSQWWINFGNKEENLTQKNLADVADIQDAAGYEHYIRV